MLTVFLRTLIVKFCAAGCAVEMITRKRETENGTEEVHNRVDSGVENPAAAGPANVVVPAATFTLGSWKNGIATGSGCAGGSGKSGDGPSGDGSCIVSLARIVRRPSVAWI